MKSGKLMMTLLLAGALMAFVACSDDENPVQQEEFGEVSGTVTLVGTWPATGDIQISIWTSYPPMGPPDAFTEPLPQPANNMLTYKIEGLAKGTYGMLTAGWRDPNDPAGAKILGVYWAKADSLGVDQNGIPVVTPLEIVIADGSMHHTNINLKANLDIIP